MAELIARFKKSTLDIHILRLGAIAIFALFGTYKWFPFEAHGLETIWTTTWLNFLYQMFGLRGATFLLGIVENIALISLIAGYWRPRLAIPGDILIVVTAITTLTLLPQLFGVEGKIDSFIFKDVLLIGTGLVLLKYDLTRATREISCHQSRAS